MNTHAEIRALARAQGLPPADVDALLDALGPHLDAYTELVLTWDGLEVITGGRGPQVASALAEIAGEHGASAALIDAFLAIHAVFPLVMVGLKVELGPRAAGPTLYVRTKDRVEHVLDVRDDEVVVVRHLESWDVSAAEGVRHVVVDAVADTDLGIIGEAIGDDTLVTGGSGVALGLPAAYRRRGLMQHKAGADALPKIDGTPAVLAGSCSAATLGQIAAFKGPHLALDTDAICRGEDVVPSLSLRSVANLLRSLDVLDASLEVGRRARLVAVDTVKTDAVDEVRMKLGAQLSRLRDDFHGDDHPARLVVPGGLVRLGQEQHVFDDKPPVIRVRDASVSDHTLMSVDASIEALAEHYVVD